MRGEFWPLICFVLWGVLFSRSPSDPPGILLYQNTAYINRSQFPHPVCLVHLSAIPPVFRRSTRKVPAFSSSHFFTFSPEPRLFLYLRHIFNALWGLFLLKIFLEYSIIMVLYGTLLGGELWRTFYDRKKRKKDSICKCMTPTGTRR